MATYAPPAEVIVPWTEPYAKSAGVWTRVQSSTILSGGYYASPTGTGNYVTYKVALGVGTYTFTEIGMTAAGYGITTVSLIDSSGGETTLGTLDWYSASLVLNVVKTITGISVTVAGVYELKLLSNTKNASASDYLQRFVLLALHRTDNAAGAISGAPLPYRFDIIPWAGTHYDYNAGAITVGQGSTYLGGGRRYMGSSLGNYMEWLVPLATGTWNLTEISTTFSDCGIRTLTLDGVTLGSVDGYSAGAVGNVVSTISGFSVSQDGIYKLRMTKSTKHASATAYASYTHHMILQRLGAVTNISELNSLATEYWEIADYTLPTWAGEKGA